MNTNTNKSILSQIQRNAVALISLIVALSSLGYNTWRNEKSEDNRNQRTAAFELLSRLYELERVIFYYRFEHDLEKGNPKIAWSYVLIIKDLSSILHVSARDKGENLYQIWNDNWEKLPSDEVAYDLVDMTIDNLRKEALMLLKNLN